MGKVCAENVRSISGRQRLHPRHASYYWKHHHCALQSWLRHGSIAFIFFYVYLLSSTLCEYTDRKRRKTCIFLQPKSCFKICKFFFSRYESFITVCGCLSTAPAQPSCARMTAHGATQSTASRVFVRYFFRHTFSLIR
jgi:hypothetical protein